jgi:predicted outer membrane protein
MNLKKMIPNLLAVVIMITVPAATVCAQIESYNNNEQDTSKKNQQDISYNFFGESGYSDAAFVEKNIEDNMKEIDLAKMAIERSENENVRSIAQLVIDDNSKMLQDLEKINGGAATPDKQQIESINEPNDENQQADDSNAVVNGDTAQSTGDPEMLAAANDPHAMLSNATGEQFDSIWIKRMLDGQKIRLGELHQARKTTGDPEIKSLVKEAIPMTRAHRDRLEDIKNPEVTSMNKP